MVKRLYRSSEERMLGGVCGGLGEYFNVDPTLVRLAFVVVAFTTGIGFLAYPIMWIVVPARPATEDYRRVEGPKEPSND